MIDGLEKKKVAIDAYLAKLKEARSTIGEVPPEVEQLLGASASQPEKDAKAPPVPPATGRPKSGKSNAAKVRDYILSKGNVARPVTEIARGAKMPRSSAGMTLRKLEGVEFESHQAEDGRVTWTVLKTAQQQNRPKQEKPPAESKVEVLDQLPTPREAVIDLLRRHPDGLRPGEIANMLDGKIQSKSRNQKNLLYATVEYLKRTEIAEKRPDGRVVLVKKE